MSGPVKRIHQTGNDRFHNRYRRSYCRKNNHQEEQHSDNRSGFAHCLEYLWQRIKHQTGSGAHSFCPHKYKYSRHDHKSGKHRYQSIKNFDLIDRFHQIDVFLNIRAVCNHDSHRHADREEKLSHRIHQNNKKFFAGHSLKIRN